MKTDDKNQLREKLKLQRAQLTKAEREALSQAAAKQVLHGDVLQGAANIGLFSSVRDEIDTTPLFRLLTSAGLRAFFPKMNRVSQRLDWGPVTRLDSMVKGPYGIHEPAEASSDVASLELIVVPGLGFGLNGGRLGYGAGWYDRTLEGFEGAVVGLGYDFQVLEAVPTEGHDHPVNWIVTELRAIPIGS